MTMKNIAAATFLVLASQGGVAGVMASDLFTKSTVEASHPISALKAVKFFEAGRKALLAWGKNASGARIFSFYKLTAEDQVMAAPDARVVMPEEGLFYDFAALEEKNRDSLLYLSARGVLRHNLESGEAEMIAPLSSIYRRSGSTLFRTFDFARDFTGDGLADILLPDFDGYRLLVNDGTGSFLPEINLDMQVEIRIGARFGSEQNNVAPSYSQFPVYNFDANFDGKPDIVFLKDHSFLAFVQRADGGFESSARDIPLEVEMVGNSFSEQIRSDESYQDQSDFVLTELERIEDINGDGIVDIVTLTDRAKGVFNRNTDYRYYYGYENNSQLGFSDAPSSTVALRGQAILSWQSDFSGDGRSDFVAPSLKIDIGKIIGALLSGSFGVDLNFYRQSEDGHFGDKPDYKKKISIDFDLFSAQVDIPAVELADINGDGAKDMILSEGGKKLQIFLATPDGKRLFAKRSKEVSLQIPKDGQRLDTADLNDDGKGDLMLHYDRLGVDGEENKNRFVVLVAK